MTLFDEFCTEAQRRRGRRSVASVNSSPLIRRLAAETGHVLVDAGSFTSHFRASLSAIQAEHTRASKNLERLRERRAELPTVAEEQEQLLNQSTPFVTVEAVERAQSKLSAA